MVFDAIGMAVMAVVDFLTTGGFHVHQLPKSLPNPPAIERTCEVSPCESTPPEADAAAPQYTPGTRP